MSTTNPDERERSFALRVRPVVFTAAILVQFLAPALVLLALAGVIPRDPGLIMLHVGIWVPVALAALFVSINRSTYLLAAMGLSYVAGLFLVIGVSTPGDMGVVGILFPVAGYAIAALVLVFFLLREAAMRRTRQIGVDTVATVMSAPVTGLVNSVTRQRLTLRFTDQQGVERFFRIGRTGGGYSTGDTVPIRYDPDSTLVDAGHSRRGFGPHPVRETPLSRHKPKPAGIPHFEGMPAGRAGRDHGESGRLRVAQRLASPNSMRASTNIITTNPPSSASHDHAQPIVNDSTTKTTKATTRMHAV